jgi:hypothetical protein
MLWRRSLPTFTASVYFTAIMATDGPSKPAPVAPAASQQLPVRTKATPNSSEPENGAAFE